jgi:hypothetical protein
MPGKFATGFAVPSRSAASARTFASREPILNPRASLSGAILRTIRGNLLLRQNTLSWEANLAARGDRREAIERERAGSVHDPHPGVMQSVGLEPAIHRRRSVRRSARCSAPVSGRSHAWRRRARIFPSAFVALAPTLHTVARPSAVGIEASASSASSASKDSSPASSPST